MLARFTCLSSLAAGLVLAQSGPGVGTTASLDIAVVDQAKDIYFNDILDLVRSIQIPDLVQDKNHGLWGNHFTIDQDANNVSFTVDTANNAIVMRADDLSASFYCDSFRYETWPLIATGRLEVDMKTVSIGVGLQFDTQVLPDGRIVPSINSVDVLADINRNDISIEIWGNIWSTFASAFEIFFKGAVVDLIQEAITAGLQQGIPYAADKFFSSSEAQTETINGWMLDWATPEPAIVTDTALEVGIAGFMWDKKVGEVLDTSPIPSMPFHDSAYPAGF